MASGRGVRQKAHGRLSKSALGSIAGHRIADAFGRGEAEADFTHDRTVILRCPRPHLQDEGGRDPSALACGDREKFRAAFEADDVTAVRRLTIRDGVSPRIV